MPSTYAHYRFGTAMLKTMPGDIGRTAKRFRRLFDVGLHGPDLFFYYRPAIPTKIGKLGCKFHRQTGREFFSRVCRNLRLEPSEQAQAYLYGTLCHYVLDSACHRLIAEKSRTGTPSHTRIETEFDRFLMELDGKQPPYRDPLTEHMKLTEAECRVVSRFYPGAEPRHIYRSVKDMAAIRRLLELPDGKLGSVIARVMGSASQVFADMVIPDQPDPICSQLNQPLLERYAQAEAVFPEMLLQLGAHLTYNAPLGEQFALTFG